MCFEGWIPFEIAAAMVLGENIGMMITANLAAIVANYTTRSGEQPAPILFLLGYAVRTIKFGDQEVEHQSISFAHLQLAV